MTTPSERFQNRKQRLAELNESHGLHALPSEAIIQEFLASPIDHESIKFAEEMRLIRDKRT